MKYLLDHKEMKAVDTYSIKTIGIPSLVLMERAAFEVVRHLLTKITKDDRILAVSGSGNNGADAVAAARILYNMGYQSEVYLAAPPKRLSEELEVQMNIVKNLGMPVHTAVEMEKYDWVIDGVFGIGLSRNIEGSYKAVIEAINCSGTKVCAVDIPSGVFADNGQILGCAVKADMTVTFGYDKAGMVMYPGAACAGEVHVADIGFAKGALEAVAPKLAALEVKDLKAILPKRLPWSNKGTYGKLLVIAGKKNMCGAAYFCARAAYKMGTGLVKLVTPEENRQSVQTMLPEAVLDTYCGDALEMTWIQSRLDWADAVVIGPGLGTGRETEKFLQCVLRQKKPAVIDADGLNVLAKHTDWLKNHQCPVIVTPHLGEMSRLTGKSIEDIQKNLIAVCQSFASDNDIVCVLKDARSVISDGRGHTFINMSGNNGMSTGGSGDVLAGIIGGLLCQNKTLPFCQNGDVSFEKNNEGLLCQNSDVPLSVTAAGGVYIHGLAGDEAKKVTGVYGLLASDIIQYISNATALAETSEA